MRNSLSRKIIAGVLASTVWFSLAVPVMGQTAEELQAQITNLLAQLNLLQQQLSQIQGAPSAVPAVCVGVTSFERNLKMGMVGDDVKCLQALLNQDPATQVAASGAGSPGNETTFFGSRTQAAVMAFQQKYASEILASWGLTVGTGFVGSSTRAKLNELLGTGAVTPPPPPGDGAVTPPPTGAGLNVAMASNTPASGTIVGGQSLASLAKFTFTNGDSSEVKVTQLKLKRLGVSADSTLTNVYLFDGALRLTDSASVSSSVITFSDSTGIFKVPAGGSKTITVSSDIASVTAETVGVGINASSDVVTNASSVKGSFPLNGNLMSIASATLASVDFNSTTTPSAASIDPQNDYTVWQNITTIGTRAVTMSRLALREIGTIAYSDLQNFRFYVDGVQVGSAVESLDANGYVTFDLSASPKRLETGARTIKVMADIIGGSNRTFSFSLRVAADANFTDTQYGVTVLPTANNTTFSARTTGTQSVNSGTLTVSKKSDSPAGNLVNSAPAVTLAKFELKAAGERVKVESLAAEVIWTNADSGSGEAVGNLRNGKLMANGVQVGSTSNLDVDATSADNAGTTFNLGSSLIVEPGSPVTLEVVADIFDNDGTNHLENSDTLQVNLITGSSNAQGLVSLVSINVPSAATTGNQVTVAEGSLTLSQYTAYPSTSVVPPATAAKLAHFTLTAGTTEAVNINTILVNLATVTDAMDASDDLSNLYVTYGTNTSTTKPTVVDGDNSWSINYQLAAGSTIDLIVYANVAAGATDGDATSDTLTTRIRVSGVTASSATTVNVPSATTYTSGQTITFTSGALSAALDAGSPVARVVAGSKDADIAAGTPKIVNAAKFKLTAARDSFTLKEFKVKVGSGVSNALVNAILKDGDTPLATKPFAFADDAGNATRAAYFTGLSVPVPANTTKTLSIDLALSVPSADVSTSQVNAAVTLDNIRYANSQGVETLADDDDSTDDWNGGAGNALYVYRSTPTFTALALPTGQGVNLTGGATTTIYGFRTAVDAQNEIALKQLKFSVAITDATGAGTEILSTFKLFRGTTDVTNLVTIQNTTGGSLESTSPSIGEGTSTVVVTWDTEERIGAGVSYDYWIKATPSGFATSTSGNDSVSTSLSGDTAAHNGTDVYAWDPSGTGTVQQLAGDNSGTGASDYNVIWSDVSAISAAIAHAATSGSSSNDWANGYLVLDLPLDSKGVVAGQN